MSTELKSHANGVSLTRFFGGKERGSCVQVTHKRFDPTENRGPADKFF